MKEIFQKLYAVPDLPDEDRIWRRDIAGFFMKLKENVRRIYQYGFAEMVNNVISHSSAKTMNISICEDENTIVLVIADDGVGIFNKIKGDLDLDDAKEAVVELVKGKYTSDSSSHAGKGIFFSSRVFDLFTIDSDNLSFSYRSGDGFIVEDDIKPAVSGTRVSMKISKSTSLILADIFNAYSDPDKNPAFYRTQIPLRLMLNPGCDLMSRSQGRRLTARFEKFTEAVLDFSGVDIIGQGFADEVFRVFSAAHPEVTLTPLNCVRDVEAMIQHVQHP